MGVSKLGSTRARTCARVHVCRGIEESEREVFELEDSDVNPIGCVSGKTVVVRARSFDEASPHAHARTRTVLCACARACLRRPRACGWERAAMPSSSLIIPYQHRHFHHHTGAPAGPQRGEERAGLVLLPRPLPARLQLLPALHRRGAARWVAEAARLVPEAAWLVPEAARWVHEAAPCGSLPCPPVQRRRARPQRACGPASPSLPRHAHQCTQMCQASPRAPRRAPRWPVPRCRPRR